MKRILMIDDEVRRAEALVAYFEQIRDWRVELATDPDSAMAVVARLAERESAFDVILLDIMMEPGTVISRADSRGGRDTGLVLLGIICERLAPLDKPIPIIVYTARTDLDQLNADPRVARYIQKPRTARELAREIEELLARA
jgi:CheY-like chemotaxis protein